MKKSKRARVSRNPRLVVPLLRKKPLAVVIAMCCSGAALGADGDRLPDSSRISGNLSLEQEFPLASRVSGFFGGALSAGMSGGPALDEQGRVVGVNVARRVDGEQVELAQRCRER